ARERGEVGEQRELNLAQCLVLLTVGDLTARDAPHSLRDRRQGLLEQFRRLLEAAPELLGREHQDLARLERYDRRCAAPAAQARDLSEELARPDRAEPFAALEHRTVPGEQHTGPLRYFALAQDDLVGDHAPHSTHAAQRLPDSHLARRGLPQHGFRPGAHRGDSARSNPRAQAKNPPYRPTPRVTGFAYSKHPRPGQWRQARPRRMGRAPTRSDLPESRKRGRTTETTARSMAPDLRSCTWVGDVGKPVSYARSVGRRRQRAAKRGTQDGPTAPRRPLLGAYRGRAKWARFVRGSKSSGSSAMCLSRPLMDAIIMLGVAERAQGSGVNRSRRSLHSTVRAGGGGEVSPPVQPASPRTLIARFQISEGI